LDREPFGCYSNGARTERATERAMDNHEIEVILTRQLASYLTMPILIVNPDGDLVFFNEAAESIVGRRFDETGTIRRGEWTDVFQPVHDDGTPLKREEQPLFVATEHRRPCYQSSWIRGLDGVLRRIEGVAFPLLGQAGRVLGAVGVFWEAKADQSPPAPR
jgi:PAS domain-containing protein